MKTTLFTLFLVLAFASAKADLLDIDGNPIRNGGSYYIIPAIWAQGGGVSIASTGNESCPLSVVQTISELSNGLPIKLSSPYRIAYLRTNMIMQFTVVAPPSCAETPATWTIVSGEDGTKQVKLAGYENTLHGWFKIQTSFMDWTYKMVFCPTHEDTCRDIGILNDGNGKRRLVITDSTPFTVVFRKAESSAE